MKDVLNYSSLTHVGWKREINEDAFAIVESVDNRPVAFVLADGMGGHKYGEIASKIAVDYCRERLADLPVENRPDIMRELIEDIIQKANIKVYLASLETPKYNGMGTTLTFAVFYPDSVYIGHIGDSRCYVFRDNVLDSLTTDHTVVQEMVSAGTLTEVESMNHPQRHYLTQALGSPEYLQPDYVHIDLRRRDRFLLCSDGLHGYVEKHVISKVLENAESDEKVCNELVDYALRAGGHDNITVISVSYALS